MHVYRDIRVVSRVHYRCTGVLLRYWSNLEMHGWCRSTREHEWYMFTRVLKLYACTRVAALWYTCIPALHLNHCSTPLHLYPCTTIVPMYYSCTPISLYYTRTTYYTRTSVLAQYYTFNRQLLHFCNTTVPLCYVWISEVLYYYCTPGLIMHTFTLVLLLYPYS